jgi:hypothetical protein
MRTVARFGTRGVLLRQLAYWSIDVVIARRRAQEYAAGRVRWEATKIVLSSERALAREEKVMDYRSFVRRAPGLATRVHNACSTRLRHRAGARHEAYRQASLAR